MVGKLGEHNMMPWERLSMAVCLNFEQLMHTADEVQKKKSSYFTSITGHRPIHKTKKKSIGAVQPFPVPPRLPALPVRSCSRDKEPWGWRGAHLNQTAPHHHWQGWDPALGTAAGCLSCWQWRMPSSPWLRGRGLAFLIHPAATRRS